MPLIEILEAPAPLLDAEAPARFAVERPTTGEHFEGSELEIVGWVLGQGAARFEVVQAGAVVRTAPVDHPRPDVRTTFPEATGPCGFSTRISVEDWKEKRFDLRAVFPGGAVVLGSIRARRIWREDIRPLKSPFVSVVIPGSKGRAHESSLESILAQDYPNFEIVIVGNAKSDEADLRARRFPWVSEVRADKPGLAAAWNTGIRRTVGDYLLFLRPGQLVTRGAIGSALEAFRDHPESGILFGRRPPRESLADGEFLLFRRSIFESVGVFGNGGQPMARILAKITRRFPSHSLDEPRGAFSER